VETKSLPLKGRVNSNRILGALMIRKRLMKTVLLTLIVVLLVGCAGENDDVQAPEQDDPQLIDELNIIPNEEIDPLSFEELQINKLIDDKPFSILPKGGSDKSIQFSSIRSKIQGSIQGSTLTE